MGKSDFYLAAAAVIPLLMFVDLAAQAVNVPVRFRNSESALRVHRRLSRAMRFVPLGWLFWWLFYGWAEWICLRSLETGRSATGGPVVIWVALAFLGVQAMGSGVSADFSIGEPTAEPGVAQTRPDTAASS